MNHLLLDVGNVTIKILCMNSATSNWHILDLKIVILDLYLCVIFIAGVIGSFQANMY